MDFQHHLDMARDISSWSMKHIFISVEKLLLVALGWVDTHLVAKLHGVSNKLSQLILA